MIIKPYLQWPKLSTLKVGDTIRIRENIFLVFTIFNHKWVIIKSITFPPSPSGCVIDCEWEYNGVKHKYCYSIETFEVKIDK